ncbi:U3 snoRNP-associated protein Sof1 [Hesseltinella vesiculosa]|uniref:DDB1- and CUL4-associated factor 13 n=1 Tax=Hesseltinella vesiculosa TaxID=101127 RepID=A0A1X2GKW9_9FUNG|nr:U3 snoRNP-associated protein Sof1 [Hesseltinella vesiculosa]
MKIKTISRSSADYVRERSQDIHKVQRNLDPTIHPFEQGREYVRALNATKLGRMFAKPFVAGLSGHIDGVYCMTKHPHLLSSMISGSGDGEIRVWNLSEQETSWSVQAHKGMVTGVSAGVNNDQFLSCSTDKTIKIWQPSAEQGSSEPLETYLGQYSFTGLSHHRKDPLFITSGNSVELWDEQRSEPIQDFAWGADSYQTVKFNQVETNIFSSCGTDRTIVLYDLRTSKPISKMIMTLKTNAICWNPIEAYTFATANEDHNAYIFDMRNMKAARNVLKDHVSAVMDVDYSPTGQEIVTGSYDRTIRLYDAKRGHSYDVYHTKRMQRVFSVQYSMDSKFVLSGSDDGNVRIWKAHANEKLGIKDRRERTHLEYMDKLKERYGHMKEIKRIDRHRHVPVEIKRADHVKKEMLQARKNKDERRRKYDQHKQPRASERSKNIIGVSKQTSS